MHRFFRAAVAGIARRRAIGSLVFGGLLAPAVLRRPLVASCDGELDASGAAEQEAADSEGETTELGPPEEFDDIEHSKSFPVQEMSGMNLMLMTAFGKPERERVSVGVQLFVDRSVSTMVIVSDDRAPSSSAVFQPSPDGPVLRLALTRRFTRLPLVLDGDLQLGATQVFAGRVGFKYRGPDFLSTLNFKAGQAGKFWDFAYHQFVTPQLSLGGALTAECPALLPLPVPVAITPSAFGVYVSPSREHTVLARWNKADDSLSLRYHRQVNKALELGAGLSASTATLDSGLVAGARMALGFDPAMQGPALTLTVNASTALKVCVSLQQQYVTQLSSSQMLAVINGTFDHRSREHSVGAMLQFHY